MSDLTIKLGGTAADDGAAFLAAWHRGVAGEDREPNRVVALHSWEVLASLLTAERLRLMRHVRRHAPTSTEALATALGRSLRDVEGDVRALVDAGLMAKEGRALEVRAERIEAMIELV